MNFRPYLSCLDKVILSNPLSVELIIKNSIELNINTINVINNIINDKMIATYPQSRKNKQLFATDNNNRYLYVDYCYKKYRLRIWELNDYYYLCKWELRNKWSYYYRADGREGIEQVIKLIRLWIKNN